MGRLAAVVFSAFTLAFVLGVGSASAETRSLKLYFLHTGEKAEITFKRNGSYDQAGLKKLNQFLRDWRRNEPTKMDPRLFDLIWEAYKTSGSNDYIHVVCGYRSPATNSMLRSRSKGVAEKSQHMLGKAMDFYIPDVKLKKLREIGLRMQGGGVGYYPRSGSPFVHFDVGNVRHWPKMSRKELVAVFPNGKTLHVPSDGKPLPGYQEALASYQARKKSGVTALALASSKPSRSGGLLSALFGGGADEEEDSAPQEAAPVKAKAPKAVAQPVEADEALPGVAGTTAPAPFQPAIEEPVAKTPEAIIAALPARDIPLPAFAPRPKADVGPQDMPFGQAEALPEDMADAEEDGADVPLPSWRPDASGAQDPVVMALASAEDDGSMTDAGVPLPRARPGQDTLTVAGLPDADQIGDEIKASNQRLAALAPAGRVKKAVVTDEAAPVRSTAKSARPSAGDTQPTPKPQVVAAQPDAARWALASADPNGVDYVATLSGRAGKPSVAHKLVRATPSEVYVSGFQQGSQVADAGRFTGKAVTFLPVARFTN